MKKEEATISELLQYIKENDKIDLDKIRIEYEMKKYEELLNKHPYNIWQGKNGSWYTYLPNEKKGRELKKRSTEQKVKDLIVEYYKEKEINPTIEEVFKEWLQQKLEYKEIQKGSADRYETDFKRFFVKTKFGERRIKTIKEDELERFIRLQIAQQSLTMKSYSEFRIIVRGIWMYAKKKKWTDISISQFFGDLAISRNTFKKNVKEAENEVFAENEIPVIVEYLKRNASIWNLGVLLVLQTGVRVGELAALKPCDWNGGNILKIRRTEIRYKNEKGKNVVDVREFAKSEAGMRDIILSDGGVETLKQIRLLNPYGTYMFENVEGKRIRGNTFNKKLDSVLRQLGLHHRSIHKGRKTYGTTLIDAGCEDSLVMNQLGHTSIETSRKYYYYSNRTREHQIEQIKQAVLI